MSDVMTMIEGFLDEAKESTANQKDLVHAVGKAQGLLAVMHVTLLALMQATRHDDELAKDVETLNQALKKLKKPLRDLEKTIIAKYGSKARGKMQRVSRKVLDKANILGGHDVSLMHRE